MKTFFHYKPEAVMKLKSIFSVLLIAPGITYAALLPRYQNMYDLDVIVEFIKQDPRILATLESINFKNYTVHYRNGCVATFERKAIPKSPGWVGPADPLEFKRSTCSTDY